MGKKKKLRIFFIVVFIAFVLTILFLNLPKLRCSVSGGEWFSFPTTCVDDCERYSGETSRFCGLMVTDSCKCGANSCWDGVTCVSRN